MSNILDNAFALSHIAWFWGILAESTRTKGQRSFHVYIPDLTPMRNGDVVNKGSKTQSKLFNIISQSWETTEAKLSKTVVCEYLNFETSRDVPDMYKGQQVLVLNYGCDDRWFWMPLERDDYLKTFEHVKFRCADIASIHKQGETDEDTERQIDLTENNTYFIEVDTKYKKHVLISTAGTDGEKYRYFFKIDAKEHTVEIWDGLVDQADPERKCLNVPHNTIKLESDPAYSQGYKLKGRITLQNEAGCTFMLEDEDMKMVVPRDLTVFVGRNVTTNIEGDHARTVTGNEHIKIKSNKLQDILGEYREEVFKDYLQFCHSDRKEEVGLNYLRSVTLDETKTCNNEFITVNLKRIETVGTLINTTTKDVIQTYVTQTTTVADAYTILANNITIQANAVMSVGATGNVTMWSGGSASIKAAVNADLSATGITTIGNGALLSLMGAATTTLSPIVPL